MLLWQQVLLHLGAYVFFSNYFQRMLQNRPVKVSIAAAATCVIFLPFAVESHKSYWSGCIRVRWRFGSKVFFASALMIFLVQYFLKSVPIFSL